MPAFLDTAVAATRGELRIASAEALARSARSGVIDVPEAERITLLPARGKTLGWLIAAALVLVGGLLMLVIRLRASGGVRVLVSIGAVVVALLMVGGVIGGLVMAAATVTKTAGRLSAMRPPVPPEFTRGETAGIEPPATYGRFKLVADDVGVLYHDPVGRRVLIDGAAHRYLIAGQDIVRAESKGGALTNGMGIEFRIGDATLPVVIATLTMLPTSESAEIESPATLWRRRLLRTLDPASADA